MAQKEDPVVKGRNLSQGEGVVKAEHKSEEPRTIFCMDIVKKVYRFYESWQGEKRIIGASVCGLPLVAVFVGRHSYPQIIVQYSIHAREWVTALLAQEQILRGVHRGGAWFVPMVNPDGVLLSVTGEAFLRQIPPWRAEFLRQINGSGDFGLWKANANAVDLNVNFSAGWGMGESNVFMPAPENYIGRRAVSEPETRALKRVTPDVCPDATLSYHTKGEEIYWEYGQKGEALARDERIAAALAEETGYAATKITGSGGGYKDWCIREKGIPAFTIEAGSDALKHPLKECDLAPILVKNRDVVRRLAEAL